MNCLRYTTRGIIGVISQDVDAYGRTSRQVCWTVTLVTVQQQEAPVANGAGRDLGRSSRIARPCGIEVQRGPVAPEALREALADAEQIRLREAGPECDQPIGNGRFAVALFGADVGSSVGPEAVICGQLTVRRTVWRTRVARSDGCGGRYAATPGPWPRPTPNAPLSRRRSCGRRRRARRAAKRPPASPSPCGSRP